MTTFPGSPPLLKAGLVLVDPASGAVRRVIALQYTPDTLTRTLQPQGVGGTSQNRSEALRLKGPPIETIKLDAEIDGTDQLEFPANNPAMTEHGIAPQIAALEALVNPSTDDLLGVDSDARGGTLEILPPEAPLVIFVWSRNRVAPVRVTDFSVTEEAFDPDLNPIRAKISLGLRVLSVADLGFDTKAGSLYLEYQRQKERAAAGLRGTFSALGLRGIP